MISEKENEEEKKKINDLRYRGGMSCNGFYVKTPVVRRPDARNDRCARRGAIICVSGVEEKKKNL